MLVLIGSPLFLLTLIVLGLRIFRRISRMQDLRPQLDFGVERNTPTPTEQFRTQTWLPLCQRIDETVQRRAGRQLTPTERRRIWETRAPLILETAMKEIEAGDNRSITSLIASLPSGLRRPDPTNWCQSTLIS